MKITDRIPLFVLSESLYQEPPFIDPNEITDNPHKAKMSFAKNRKKRKSKKRSRR